MIIPAQTGFFALVSFGYSEDQYFTTKVPIIAWRFSADDPEGPTAITPEGPVYDDKGEIAGGGVSLGILYPTGQVYCPFVAHYDNELDWQKAAHQEMTDHAARRKKA